MRVLILAPGEDTGGVGIGIVSAFRKHAPDWDVRFVRRINNYIDYPVDIEWTPDTERTVLDLFEKANVIHFFQKFSPIPGWEDKRKVLHHHGTAFRRDPVGMLRSATEHHAINIASTFDLTTLAPGEVTWIPNPCDVEVLSAMRAGRVSGGVTKFCHAPTIRERKSTDKFLTALSSVAQLKPVSLELIERVPWKTCLARKINTDVYFDQLTVGYGNNAIECWAMGIPVIAGIDERNASAIGQPVPSGLRDAMAAQFEIPFYETNETDIAKALLAMTDHALREEYAAKGLRHVRTWHDGAVVVEKLKKVYEAA